MKIEEKYLYKKKRTKVSIFFFFLYYFKTYTKCGDILFLQIKFWKKTNFLLLFYNSVCRLLEFIALHIDCVHKFNILSIKLVDLKRNYTCFFFVFL